MPSRTLTNQTLQWIIGKLKANSSNAEGTDATTQSNTRRIELIEAVLFNDISENEFLILFADLDGITATGVWNAALQRIEC